nr:MAG TPA: tail fiber protein [Caudoviricetes sp.]
MAETNFFELFKATWAQNGTTDRISAAQYGTGWAYIGSLPPSVEQFNAVQQLTDQRLTWIYRHLEAVAALTGRELTAPGSDAISYAFQNLNASRLTAGTVPVERLPEKAPAMTVGAAAKWETPRSISISGGAMARAKPLDGSADLALEVTGLSMSTATDVLAPIHGGTGQNWIPPGNYLVGNGTAAMASKTPGQVFNDIGVSQAISLALQGVGLGTTYAGNGITDLDDITRGAGLYYTTAKGPKNWLGDGFLLHRAYGNAGFQLGNVYGSGVLQFRERAQGEWKKPITLANLDDDRRIPEINSRYPNMRSIKSGDDLNTYTESNDYYIYAPAPNTPPGWAGKALLRVRAWESLVFQEFIHWGAEATRWWRMRVSVAAGWGPWHKVAELDSPAFTGAPTAPTPSVEDRGSTRIATVQYIDWRLSAFSRSPSIAQLGVVGWWRCGDTGLIRQWGLSRGAGDGEAWITFPIPFPNVCLGGSVTHAGRFNVSDDAGVGLVDPSTTGAYLRNGAWNSVMLYWEVWGY